MTLMHKCCKCYVSLHVCCEVTGSYFILIYKYININIYREREYERSGEWNEIPIEYVHIFVVL